MSEEDNEVLPDESLRVDPETAKGYPLDQIENIPDRMVVIEYIYHQQHNQPAMNLEHRYKVHPLTSEQPYQRRCVATEQYQPIDRGWFENGGHGLVVIKNDEPDKVNEIAGIFPQDVDSEEGVLEVRGKVDGDLDILRLEIPPGQSFRANIVSLVHLYVRCLKGKANYTLTIFPG